MGACGLGSAFVVACSVVATLVGWVWEENKVGIDALVRREWPVEPSEDHISAEKAVRAAREKIKLLGHTPAGEFQAALVFRISELACQWQVDCESCSAYVDAETGELRRFCVFLRKGDKDRFVGKTREDAIAREKAIQLAIEAAGKLGVHLDRRKLVVEYEDTMDRKAGDLYGAEWCIRQYHDIQGMRSLDSGVTIWLCALDGAVKAVTLGYSLDALAPEEWNITRDEAVRLIGEALPVFDMHGMQEVGLRIVNPMRYYMAHEPREPIVCWVWQEPRPGGRLFVRILFVNAKSGRVYVYEPMYLARSAHGKAR